MPRWGAMSLSSNTQGDALGCRLVGPPGRFSKRHPYDFGGQTSGDRLKWQMKNGGVAIHC